MEKDPFGGRCYVCRKWCSGERLGRMRLPLVTSPRREVWMRIVCYGCAAAINDSWRAAGHPEDLAIHGF